MAGHNFLTSAHLAFIPIYADMEMSMDIAKIDIDIALEKEQNRRRCASDDDKDRVTARERVKQLLDENSFIELDESVGHQLPHTSVVTGYGTVDGRGVAVFAQGGATFGGALSEAAGQKILKITDFALKAGCPIIGIHDAGYAATRVNDTALGVYGTIFRRQVHASGVIPQISVIMGSCVGSVAHSPALADFIVAAERAFPVAVNSPDLISTVTGENVSLQELGDARIHSSTSGLVHHMAGDEENALEYVRLLLSYLPSNNLEEPPLYPQEAGQADYDLEAELDTIVPDSPRQPYDMHHLIECVLDDEEILETQPLFAPNIVTGFGRIDGQSVGIVANQPMQLDGCLDIDACEKAARFVRTCDSFNVPVLTFVDVPGFLPDLEQEHMGIIRRSAKLIYAYGEATVPLITVIIRKAYGSAYEIMGSQYIGTDFNFAWPTAEIAATGPHASVNILLSEQQTEMETKDEALMEGRRIALMAECKKAFHNPYVAAKRGGIDAVIQPSQTRHYIINSLRALCAKRATLPPKKHGNISL